MISSFVFLFGCVFVDIFSMFRVMTINEKNRKDISEEEEQIYDKIILYNEIIDVMRSLLNIINQKKKEIITK